MSSFNFKICHELIIDLLPENIIDVKVPWLCVTYEIDEDTYGFISSNMQKITDYPRIR